MRWWLEDVENARIKARDKIAPVANALAKELQLNKNDDLFILGGFVRDNVLSALTNKETNSKDLDLILPNRPDLDKNPNIIWKKENSLGGLKIGTKNFPEIDVFQPGVKDVELIVGQYFDFNCNSLYYSHRIKQIFPSAYFYGFTSNKTIDFLHACYTENGIEQRYPNSWVVSRALKFQIQFKHKYGFETKLSPNILYLLYEMDKKTEQEMFDYTKIKVKSESMQKQIINEYKRLKNY